MIYMLNSSPSLAVTAFPLLNSVRYLYLLFATQRVLIIMIVNKLSSNSLAGMQYPPKTSFQVSSLFTASTLHCSLRT